MMHADEEWPLPEYDREVEPHFLFIVTPPYSGSTALCQLLNSSERSMVLDPRGEGQWLIPGLSRPGRWDAEKYVDFESVKAVWLARFQRELVSNSNIDVVIEKSPPNMMRMEKLSSQFKSCSFIANNRNPYAICASIMYRHVDAENLEESQRIEFLTKHAKDWLMRSAKIRELILVLDAPLITYETFCQDPASVLPLIAKPTGLAGTINTRAKVKVKDYPSSSISDQNARQIANLSRAEVEHLTSFFGDQIELLNFYGYQLL